MLECSYERLGVGGALLVDLVTEWDVKVEELVKSEISKAYPTFQL